MAPATGRPVTGRPATSRIVRLGAGTAAQLAARAGETGRVHSVFSRAANIAWPDGRLLTLHGPGSLLSPFAAAVDDVSRLRALQPGAPVSCAPPRLHTPMLALSWAAARVVDCTPPPAPVAAPARLARWLEAGRPPHAPSLDSPRGTTACRALADGIGRADAARLVEGARALLGLGEGLTPAGDDCLVGALAVLHHARAVWPGEISGLGPAIAQAARERTTTIGGEFVRYALEGSFSEPVLAVLRARSRDQLARAAAGLLALGATSGADTIHGMRLASVALAGAPSA
jgi:hypothetical protein